MPRNGSSALLQRIGLALVATGLAAAWLAISYNRLPAPFASLTAAVGSLPRDREFSLTCKLLTLSEVRHRA